MNRYFQRDFTLSLYKKLLEAAIDKGYAITSFKKYILQTNSSTKVIILRHDVDGRPENSYLTAQIESIYNIQSTYYFRIVEKSFNANIIKKIVNLNHEIGYHYEDLALCNGDLNCAIESFTKNLNQLRRLYPVKTICMHGSPLSKWDNKLLWREYNYRDYGIIGEPYFDLNFNELLYLTDTGRRWDGDKFSIRDKILNNNKLFLHSTYDIINKLQNNELAEKIMITTHPQRWNDNFILWNFEVFSQSLKNIVKKIIIKKF